jgi:hypothetical protein
MWLHGIPNQAAGQLHNVFLRLRNPLLVVLFLPVQLLLRLLQGLLNHHWVARNLPTNTHLIPEYLRDTLSSFVASLLNLVYLYNIYNTFIPESQGFFKFF